MSHLLRAFLRPFRDKRTYAEFLVGLVLLGLMLALASTRLLDNFENLFLDMRFKLRGERPFPSVVNLIGVDEASLDVFGRWPWPRNVHAEVLDALRHKSFRPAVVGYDFLFENRNSQNPEGDKALVFRTQNMEEKIVMAYFFEKGLGSSFERDEIKEGYLEQFAFPDSSSAPEKLDTADKVSLPFTELAAASQLAFVNTPVDNDGRTRRAQLLMRYRGKIYPSMDLLLVFNYLGVKPKDVRLEKRVIVIEESRMGKRVIPISARGNMLINYYGSQERISSYSVVEVLKAGRNWMMGSEDPQLLRSFKDKIVLVGVTALGLGDRRVTPFQQYESGLSLHAQVIANILDQSFLVRVSPGTSYAALLLVSLIVIGLTIFLRITYSLPAVLGLCLFYFGAAHLFFLKGIWIDVAVQEVTLVVLFIGITCFRYFLTLEELKRTQAQLIQSTKMAALGQLSAGIAHEFRNILNLINLNVECCSKPGLPAERIQYYLERYKSTAASARTILESLLVFARRSESVKKPGNLKKTLEATLQLIEGEVNRFGITIHPELHDVPEISYDSGQISQVVINLMSNARDALRDLKDREKQITLRLWDNSDKIQLEIGDNGPGIPPQILKRLFEPFATTKPEGQGTGLGLSVCHGIIRNHGGDITVTTAADKGTTWHITLPKM